MRTKLIYAAIILISLAFVWVVFYFVKVGTYKFLYEGFVKQTITEMVKKDSLK